MLHMTDAVNDMHSKLGDFCENTGYGLTASAPYDYFYDDNGNMTMDINKGIRTINYIGISLQAAPGITYNHLNLPYLVKIARKDIPPMLNMVKYIYDAAGNKLEKRVLKGLHFAPGPSQTLLIIDGVIYEEDVTSYIGGFVYQNNKLQLISHEEGRIRPAGVKLPNGQTAEKLVFDYFLKDHLGNVRMVLTGQKETKHYIATMEMPYRQTEEALFSNLQTSAFARTEVPGDYPEDPDETDPNDFVARLNGSGPKVGPSIVLKVMSGDKVDIAVKSLYRDQQSSGGTTNPAEDILMALAGGIVGVAGEVKGTQANLGDPVSSPLLGALNSFREDYNLPAVDKPKAYLNWILLDEQFKYVGTGLQSGAKPVTTPDILEPLAQPGIEITKSGYLYIYVSNETEDWNVFFDNLSVRHYTGELVEETHYYPWGLAMAGISSKALKSNYAENRRKFNYGSELASKEFSDGSGLEWYETNFRSLDPQLGRWWQIDPHAEYHLSTTAYGYVLNNPLLYNDPFGLDTVKVFGSGKHDIKIRKGDVLAWYIQNTISYYTYDPENVDAVNGFVGGGIDNRGEDMPSAVVTAKRKYKYGSNGGDGSNYAFPWLGLAGTGASTGSFLFHNNNGWYSIKQNKFYSPRFHGNQYTGGRVKSAKANSLKLTYLGYGLGAFNAYDINRQYQDGEINKGQMQMEQGSNIISTAGGIYGAAWGVGWETGKYVTSIPWYRANIRPHIQDLLGAKRDEVFEAREAPFPGTLKNK